MTRTANQKSLSSPSARWSVAFAGTFAVLVLISFLGAQGARVGPWLVPELPVWFLVVSAFVLLVLDRGAQPLKGRVALAVSGIALTLACIGLQSWRGSLLETQSLTARVFRPSRSDGRPEGVAAVDTVRLPSRRYINRLAGRRRDVGLVIATFLNVPRAGTYRFELDADDRATLVIDERTVIENAGSLVAEVEASPGGARSAFAPSSSTSHMDGKSEATMGRPHAIASKSLSGEVNKRAVIESKFGITKTLACRFSASSSGGGTKPRKCTRSSRPSSAAKRFTRSRSGSGASQPTTVSSPRGTSCIARTSTSTPFRGTARRERLLRHLRPEEVPPSGGPEASRRPTAPCAHR